MSCIYFLRDKEEIVYIGISKSFVGALDRAKTHSATSKHFTSIDFLDADDSMAAAEESRLIIKHTPKYNKSLSNIDDYINLSELLQLIKESILAESETIKVGNKYYLTRSDGLSIAEKLKKEIKKIK